MLGVRKIDSLQKGVRVELPTPEQGGVYLLPQAFMARKLLLLGTH